MCRVGRKTLTTRPRIARTDENINFLDGLVFSPEDAPQSYKIVI